MKTALFIIVLVIVSCQARGQTQWQAKVLPPDYKDSYWLDIYFLPSDTLLGWAVGAKNSPPVASKDGAVARTTDAGKTWECVTIIGSQMLESVHFLDKDVGYASGTKGIYKSINGGINWTELTLPDTLGGWGCHFIDRDNGLYIGGGCGNNRNSNPQRFYRTSDGGITWTRTVYNAPDNALTDPLIIEKDGLGYASGSGWIWRTLDGGRTWRVWISTGNIKGWQEEITNIGDSFLVPTSGLDCNSNENYGDLRFTTDAGKSWNTFATGFNMFGTYLTSAISGWGVGTSNEIFFTADAGTSWTNVNCGIDAADVLDDIWFIHDDWGWAVGSKIYEYRTVQPRPLTILLNRTMPLCPGDTIELTADQDFENYRWSDGATGKTRRVTKAGKYSVTGKDPWSCRDVTADIEVLFYPVKTPTIQLSGSTILCNEGDSLELSAQQWSQYPITWSNGSKNTIISISESGEYWFSGIDENGCAFTSDTIQITKAVIQRPTVRLSDKAQFCIGDSITLMGSDGFTDYVWNNGLQSKSIIVKESGIYFFKALDIYGCERISDTITVTVLPIKNSLVFLNTALPIRFDSVNAQKIYCKEIIIKNTGIATTILFPYFIRNTVFSLPPSQFPLRLATGEEKSLTLCFAPDTIGFHCDTLIINDTCKNHRLPVQSSLLTLGDITIDGACDIPLRVRMKRSGSTYYIAPPHPNPTSDGLRLSVIGKSDFESVPYIRIIDNLGNVITTTDTPNRLRTAHSETGQYEWQISTQGWMRGHYAVILHIEDSVLCYPITVY